ncbi:unnamed protein product, partial [Symbiodinium pilosum]
SCEGVRHACGLRWEGGAQAPPGAGCERPGALAEGIYAGALQRQQQRASHQGACRRCVCTAGSGPST